MLSILRRLQPQGHGPCIGEGSQRSKVGVRIGGTLGGIDPLVPFKRATRRVKKGSLLKGSPYYYLGQGKRQKHRTRPVRHALVLEESPEQNTKTVFSSPHPSSKADKLYL